MTDNDKLLDDFCRSYDCSIIKKNYVVIDADFNMWDDYTFDEKTQIRTLKPDAIPCNWRVNGIKFKTLGELIVWLQLNCINNEGLHLNLRNKEATLFLDAWREANV